MERLRGCSKGWMKLVYVRGTLVKFRELCICWGKVRDVGGKLYILAECWRCWRKFGYVGECVDVEGML